MRGIIALASALVTGTAGIAHAQEHDASSRQLRKEVVVDAPIEEVWHAWTTPEGLSFISTKSNVELRVGGPYEWFLDLPPDENGRRGGEGARVLAFLPHEMLAFDWTFPPAVPSLRNAGEKTQVVVLFDETDEGVRIRFTQHGWRDGDDWDAGYRYFDQAWSSVLQALRAHLEGGA